MPLMMLCIYLGIPRHNVPQGPKPSWRGFTYFSFGLALLYGALDQGERLDWLHSGLIVGLFASGSLLIIATFIRSMRQPNPIANLALLRTRNVMILASSIFVFRFVMLTPVVLIPGFLGNIQRYRPLQTGHALAWVALPQFLLVWAVAWVIIRTNSRLIFAAGLTIIAGACWRAARVDPSWAGNSFESIELVLAVGLACAYVGMAGSIVLEALEAGALSSAQMSVLFRSYALRAYFRRRGGSVCDDKAFNSSGRISLQFARAAGAVWAVADRHPAFYVGRRCVREIAWARRSSRTGTPYSGPAGSRAGVHDGH